MARGRFLSTSVAEDERLSKLSLTAELLYLKTIPHLDRDGMISGRAGYLWGRVCPLREELMLEMQGAIEEWVAVGLVIRMVTETGPVLFFPGFLKNNNLLHYERESPSKFPPPPGYVRTEDGLLLEGAEPKRKRKTKETQVPPASNDSGEEVQELVNDDIMEIVLDFSPKGEVQDQVQVEVKDQEKAAEARAPAAAVADMERVWKAWDKNMPGTRTPVIVDAVNNLLDDYSAAEIEEAITIACKRQRRSFDYVLGILRKGAFTDHPHPSAGDYRSKHGSHRQYSQARSGQTDGGDTPPLDPDIQRRVDAHRERRKAEGSTYYQ